ncbi:MAG: hypothetical protein Q7T62_00600 [Undibacterium sp.]|nr:hypothetical protein [Undibacterium sp.]
MSQIIQVELHTHEIPRMFNRFCSLVGEDTWLTRAKKVKSEIKGNSSLSALLREENMMALSFSALSSLRQTYGVLPSDVKLLQPFYMALGFAAQALSLMENSDPQSCKRILGRVKGAFRNPDDMRAMQVELLAATHFTRKGFQVAWPEAAGGRHDIDVVNLGSHGLQVECKSVSNDKGRKIHRREALEFFSLIEKGLRAVSTKLTTGLILVITVPDRLPTQFSARKQLGSRILEQFMLGKSIELDDSTDIRIGEFDFSLVSEKMVGNTWRGDHALVDAITGTINREAMMIGGESGGVLVVVQSRKDDSFLGSLFGMLETSAKSQVSKTKPVLFFVSFHGLQGGELKEVGDETGDQPTALRVRASEFLNRTDIDHVVGVHFADRGSLVPRVDSDRSHVGNVYSFKKSYSPYWEDQLDSLFR